MSDRATIAHRIAIAAWLLLAASVAGWPFAGAGIGKSATLIGFLPLLLPLTGIVRRSKRALRAAPMALAPAMTLSITEILVNPPARPWAGVSLALAFSAFAAILAALRTLPRD